MKDVNVENANRILQNMIDDPPMGNENKNMAIVCKNLADFCKVKKLKDKEIFFKFSKLFEKLYKEDIENKAFINFWFDKTNKKIHIEKDVDVLTEIIDLKKNKGEECIVTHRTDGTITIEIGGVNLRVPKKIWNEYED